MAVRFFLRSDRDDKPVTIYARFRAKGTENAVSTKLKIESKYWNDKSGQVKTGGKIPEYALDVRENLGKIVNALSAYEKVDTAPTIQGINFRIDAALGRIQSNPHKKTKATAPREYLSKLIEDMRNGDAVVPHKETSYQNSTIRAWVVFQGVFNGFCDEYEANNGGEPLSWSAIDGNVGTGFIKYCKKSRFLTKTTNKYIKSFKAMIRRAYDDGLHNNYHCLRQIGTIEEKPYCTQEEIYLTTNEIKALAEMPLKGREADARDVFLVGCYTGQRFSDYSQIGRDNIVNVEDVDGTIIPIIKLVQQKTQTLVELPIIDDNLITILERRNYKLPTICDVVVNRLIKEICKRLSKTVTSLADPVVTTITKAEADAEREGHKSFERNAAGRVVRPKYELVRTHTARRSCITNLTKDTRLTTAEIMSISGHSTERNFRTYVRTTKQENAVRISRKLRK